MRALLVTLTACLFVVSTATAKYSGGTGEPNDPYQIATAADLIALGETPEDYGKHFILTADIDLDPNLPGGKVFDRALIAPDTNDAEDGFQGTLFAGVFDGRGHTISHLTIRGDGYLGLFGQVGSWDAPSGEVRDLGVVDVNIIGTGWFVGGLVGSNWESNLTQCYGTGAVSGNSYVGGLVGHNEYGTVTHCYSTGAVSGDSDVGGLMGWNIGDVTECYSTGAANGSGSEVGGLVGANYGSVSQCYSTGAVSGSSFVGGLVGRVSKDCCHPISGSVTQSFWDIQTSGQAVSDGGIGKTTAEMRDPRTFMAEGWDFVGQADAPDDIWAEPEGGGYPILWWQLPPLQGLPGFSGGTGEPNDPYRVSTGAELNRIGHNPRLMECHFKMVGDLDLTGIRFYPIGDYDYPYGGAFDGHGHTISHLTAKGESFVGLFGYLGCGAKVEDLGVVDVNITGSGDCVGGLAGLNEGDVSQCHSTGSVRGWSAVGGLVGDNSGDVAQCYSTGAVSGEAAVGGLVGSGANWCENGRCAVGDVTSCFWDTQISGQTSSEGGTGETTANMQNATTFLHAGWDFVGETANGTEDIWWIDEGKDYPRLRWEARD